MIAVIPSFADGRIPRCRTGFGEDLSPEILLRDVPEETVTLAVVLDDLDVPFCRAFTHWVIWNIPKTDVIPEALPKGARIREPIAACQGIAWGKHGYRGPKQPFFIRKVHHYVFRVYALDCRTELPESAGKRELLGAMCGHILAEARCTGTYRRGQP